MEEELPENPLREGMDVSASYPGSMRDLTSQTAEDGDGVSGRRLFVRR